MRTKSKLVEHGSRWRGFRRSSRLKAGTSSISAPARSRLAGATNRFFRAVGSIERVKDALDPNGIIAPGKSGIWPKGRRA